MAIEAEKERLLNLGNKLLKDQNFSGAESVIAELCKLDRGDPVPILLLSEIMVGKAEFELALSNLKTAHMLYEALQNLDGQKSVLERIDEVERLFEAALEKEVSRQEKFIENVGAEEEELHELLGGQKDLSEDDKRMQYNHVIHPYFGFIQRPRNGEKYYNNYGYFYNYSAGAYEYPYNGTTEDTYVVGVFGGSVASQLHTEVQELLALEIKKLPHMINREIVVLNFAQGGFEQPQLLIALNYFVAIGQKFDLIINVDGFNEASGKRINQFNGFHPGMPQWGMMRALRLLFRAPQLGGKASKYIGKMHLMRSYLADLNKIKNKGFLGVLTAPLRKWLGTKYEFMARNAPKIEFGDQDDMMVFHNRKKITPNVFMSDPDIRQNSVNEVVELWKRCSVLMASACHEIGAIYIHALQPNQYYSKKKFTQEETEKYLTFSKSFAGAIGDTYPQMIASKEFFDQRDIVFCDLSPSIEDESETVFRDEICHLNSLGNQRMVEYLMPKILEEIKKAN